MSLPPTPTLSVVHPQLRHWTMLRGERVWTTMPSLVRARSQRGNRSFPYVENTLTAIPCLTLSGVSRHRPLLHVGLRIRAPRRPEQALPGDTPRHCCTVIRSSSVRIPICWQCIRILTKTQCILRSLLHWSPHIQRLDRAQVRLQVDVHHRSLHLRRRRSALLA